MNEMRRLPKYGLSIGRSPAAAHDPSPALQLRRVVAVQTFSVVAEAVVDLYLDEADLAEVLFNVGVVKEAAGRPPPSIFRAGRK